MENQESIEAVLKELFTTQQFAVLATQDKGQPYVSLMAFAAAEDLKSLFFATERGTRKFTNILTDARAAVMIDNRSNQSSDIENATAVTVLGKITEVSGEELEGLLVAYVRKYPHLNAFARSDTCALIRIVVDSYYVVSRFQDVRELHFKD